MRNYKQDSEIPQYLYWNNRKRYSASSFKYYQKFYRIKSQGNPIEIPENWDNAISCYWSKLVKKNDILLNFGTHLGNDYDFVFLKELFKYELKSHCENDEEYNGIHLLTCIPNHSPLENNYSHIEILIRHRIFKVNQKDAYFDQIYTHKDWEEKTALLKKKKSQFFKTMRKEFRKNMIQLISRKSSSNHLLNDIGAFLCLIRWNKI